MYVLYTYPELLNTCNIDILVNIAYSIEIDYQVLSCYIY